MANASHIALPAACATTPRMEKMPAPTMPPIPIETAAAMPIWFEPAGPPGAAAVVLAGFEVMAEFPPARRIHDNHRRFLRPLPLPRRRFARGPWRCRY